MKKILLVTLFAAMAMPAMAQRDSGRKMPQQAPMPRIERVPVTKADYAAAQRFTPAKQAQMSYSAGIQPMWLEHSNRFVCATRRADEGLVWWLVDADRGTKKPLFDNDKMAADISRITKDPYDGLHVPIGSFRFTKDEKAIRFTVTSKFEEVDDKKEKGKKERKKFVLEYDLAKAELKELVDYETQTLPGWANVSPDGNTIIFSKGYNLWTMDRENFEKAIKDERDTTIVETQLTTQFEKRFGFGKAKSVSSDNEEVEAKERRRADVSWSPDSKHFAYTVEDSRKVKELWVVNNTARPRPTLEAYPYEMPGDKEVPQTLLYIYDVAAKENSFVETFAFKDQNMGILDGKPVRTRTDDYTINSNVWMGGNNEFLIQRLSRDARRMDICRVNVNTKEVKAIIEERSNFYLGTETPVLTNGEGSDIVYWSEEDGWGHLYLYSWEGKRLRQLTSGAWHVDGIGGVDPKTKTIFFMGNGHEKDINPYYGFLYSIKYDGSDLRLLTPGDYSHQVYLDENYRFIVENLSRVDDAPYSVLRTAGGREVLRFEKADLSGLFAAGYHFPTRFKVKAADGITDLYGTMYTPYNMDSTRLYPVVEYVYPGPQQEGVQHTFHLPGVALDRLAQLGFVVVTVGNRGGDPHRSRWYHTYGSGNLRDYGLADKKAAAIQLADRYPFMDLTRVGITGHSGGGFMSTAAILTYPDFFKVAVSNAGNHDNAIYNRGWSETHHGVKEEVSEKGDTTFVFKINNNQQLAGNLQGRLLLITGDIDDNVHPAGTISVVNELIRRGKRFDMLVLPGQRHSFGAMNEYFFWRMADYFSMWLMGDKSERPVDIPELRE